MPTSEIEVQLAAPFETTFKDVRGGVELEYVTGEQVTSRLNEVLGVAGWSFSVREHGINAEADEAWVLGRLEASIDSVAVVREQFGSQKLKRSRATGIPLDIGFDLKGAGTDALKKCAMGLGVGLYLSKKDAPRSEPERKPATSSAKSNGHAQSDEPAPPDDEDAASGFDIPVCADCGIDLTETHFKDGTSWSPGQLAGYGLRKHNRALCMKHYREANNSRRQANAVRSGPTRFDDEVPF